MINFFYNLIHQILYYSKKQPHICTPVISVGNINMGGTGKTPFTIFLTQLLKKKGYKVAILSRGYKSKLSYIKVEKKHNSKDVGDEPKMMSEYAPVYIGKDRFKTANVAIKDGANMIILDDGMQTNTIAKDLSFCVVGENGLKGLKRENLFFAKKKTDAFITINNDLKFDKPTFKFEITTSFKPIKNKKYIAFAGIGKPEKFFKTLKGTKTEILKTYSFPDHYSYTKNNIAKLKLEAKKLKAQLITTQKDWVKINDKDIQVLTIDLKTKQQKAFETYLSKRLSQQ